LPQSSRDRPSTNVFAETIVPTGSGAARLGMAISAPGLITRGKAVGNGAVSLNVSLITAWSSGEDGPKPLLWEARPWSRILSCQVWPSFVPR
jgi:hypothetical protein